jgi:ribosomal protein S25
MSNPVQVQPIRPVDKKKAQLPNREIRQYRLPVTTISLIERIALKRSVAKTAVISWALRDLAEKEGIQA